MNSTFQFEGIDQQNAVSQEIDYLPPCDSRCRNCPLFPFSKLQNSKVFKSDSFGTFIINDERRKISSQGIRLLCALARQDKTILSKDYLMRYVWPDTAIVRNNLNVAIYDLRIALTGALVYIQNHRKEGYSLTL